MSAQPWSRLIRFVDDSGRETFGEPLVSDASELPELLAKNDLWAVEYKGATPVQATEKGPKLRVKSLLDLFKPEDVPIIRCIGLNYKEHSKPPIPYPFARTVYQHPQSKKAAARRPPTPPSSSSPRPR